MKSDANKNNNATIATFAIWVNSRSDTISISISIGLWSDMPDTTVKVQKQALSSHFYRHPQMKNAALAMAIPPPAEAHI